MYGVGEGADHLTVDRDVPTPPRFSENALSAHAV